MNSVYKKIDEVSDLLTPIQLSALADMYEDGVVVNADPELALTYYQMAADMGDPYAQSIVAERYASNNEDKLAIFWYLRAAEQGNPHAQYVLGKLFSDEEGGLLWLHLSAKQGSQLAMKELSDRLLTIDPRQSKKWLKRYYRKRAKNQTDTFNSKKYMRLLKRERLPEVIDGEVVIRI